MYPGVGGGGGKEGVGEGKGIWKSKEWGMEEGELNHIEQECLIRTTEQKRRKERGDEGFVLQKATEVCPHVENTSVWSGNK